MAATNPLKLAVIPGYGTVPDVNAEALKGLGAVAKLEGITFEKKVFDWGGGWYSMTGQMGHGTREMWDLVAGSL